jgi:hypothetical protein
VILKVPVTASSVPEWVRRAAVAINDMISAMAALGTRVTALEQPPVVTSVTLTPAPLPGAPVQGMTVYDIADDKVKTWNGSAWQAHY